MPQMMCLTLSLVVVMAGGSVVSVPDLESFLGGCKHMCKSGWASVPTKPFQKPEDCVQTLCHPNIKGPLPELEPSDLARLPPLADFVEQCGKMCEAEWWLISTFKDAEDCHGAVCEFPVFPPPTPIGETATPATATAKVLSVPQGAPQAAWAQAPEDCGSHDDCVPGQFCGRLRLCVPIAQCTHAKTHPGLQPLDGQCPPAVLTKGERAEHCPRNGCVVVRVRVFSGNLIDRVVFEFSDGSSKSFGTDGGTEQPAFEVPSGQVLTWIKTMQGDQLDGVQFFTDRGTSSIWYGNRGGRRATFHVDAGSHLTALDRPTGAASKIDGVGQRPRAPAVSTA